LKKSLEVDDLSLRYARADTLGVITREKIVYKICQ